MNKWLKNFLSFIIAFGFWQQTLAQAPVDIIQHLGTNLPSDVLLTNEKGTKLHFGDLASERSLILVFAYYDCPNLCTFIISDLMNGLKPLPFKVGKDFDVAVVSINPANSPALAATKKAAYLKKYGYEEGASGWHFLTGAEQEVKRLADAAGFIYTYDAATGQYQHPSALIILTPDGQISRYLLGLGFKSRDLRLALFEASNHKIGNVVERILLLCFHYDAQNGKYATPIAVGLQALGAVSLFGLGAIIWISRRSGKVL